MDVNDRIESLTNIIQELVRIMDPQSISSDRRGRILQELDKIQESIEFDRLYSDYICKE